MTEIEAPVNFDEIDNARKKKVAYTPGNEWQRELKTNLDGAIKANSLVNAKLFILHEPLLKGLIAFDDFSERIVKQKAVPELMIEPGEWNGNDEVAIRVYLEQKYSILFGKDYTSDAVISVAKANSFNVVKNRIESIAWDKKPRAECYFIDYLGAEDNEYTKAITKIWLTGAIARVYNPGVKFEIVPILEGKQGIGKSTCIRNLYPDKFSDSLKGLGTNKDDYQLLPTSWLFELGELKAMTSTDIDTLKNFISAQKDEYRESYGRYTNTHLRKCVFIGSTNSKSYLRDETGERRFYPIHCGVNDTAKNVFNPEETDILQILAEAKFWYDNHEPLTPDATILTISKQYQEDAKLIDPTKDAIDDFLETPVPANWEEWTISQRKGWYSKSYDSIAPNSAPDVIPLQQVSTREIMEIIFDLTPDKYNYRLTNKLSKRIKSVMDNNPNWKPSDNVLFNGRRKKGYKRVENINIHALHG